VQQGLASAHTALMSDERPIDLKPWLYRIVHNAALNVLRGERDVATLDDHEAEQVVPGVEAQVEDRERFRSVISAVHALPTAQRDALLLRELEGRSHEEIATALGVTAGAARQHLMRARATMRAAVTVVTPYPLVLKLCGARSGSGRRSGRRESAGRRSRGGRGRRLQPLQARRGHARGRSAGGRRRRRRARDRAQAAHRGGRRHGAGPTGRAAGERRACVERRAGAGWSTAGARAVDAGRRRRLSTARVAQTTGRMRQASARVAPGGVGTVVRRGQRRPGTKTSARAPRARATTMPTATATTGCRRRGATRAKATRAALALPGPAPQAPATPGPAPRAPADPEAPGPAAPGPATPGPAPRAPATPGPRAPVTPAARQRHERLRQRSVVGLIERLGFSRGPLRLRRCHAVRPSVAPAPSGDRSYRDPTSCVPRGPRDLIRAC